MQVKSISNSHLYNKASEYVSKNVLEVGKKTSIGHIIRMMPTKKGAITQLISPTGEHLTLVIDNGKIVKTIKKTILEGKMWTDTWDFIKNTGKRFRISGAKKGSKIYTKHEFNKIASEEVAPFGILKEYNGKKSLFTSTEFNAQGTNFNGMVV